MQFPKLRRGEKPKVDTGQEGHEYNSRSKNESNQMRIYQGKNITILRNPPVSEQTGGTTFKKQFQIGSRLAWRILPICWVRTIPVICFILSPNRHKTEWLRFGPQIWNNLRESQSLGGAEQEYLVLESQSQARSGVLTKKMETIAPALRFFRSQILCRLYKSPSDETINIMMDAAIRSVAVRINDTWILTGSAAVRIVARGFLLPILAQRLCE